MGYKIALQKINIFCKTYLKPTLKYMYVTSNSKTFVLQVLMQTYCIGDSEPLPLVNLFCIINLQLTLPFEFFNLKKQ